MLTPAVMGIARHLLTIAGGFLVARGSLDPQDAETLVGAGMAIAGVAWSLAEKRLR
jgi:hypothetical protein